MKPSCSAVCTLFEGHYHIGVAAFINSLDRSGFLGDVYIGYRGSLPPWAKQAQQGQAINWPNAKTLMVGKGVNLHFLPVQTTNHFTNYKAEFMLSLWHACIAATGDVPGIFYFDPDIVVKAPWLFFERWISYGVALVHEIVWNDMPPTHPKRHYWGEVAFAAGITVKNKANSYLNAGFIGLNNKSLGFLALWKNLMDVSEKEFGLDKTKFFQSSHDYTLFKVADQDMLNLTAMCTDVAISEIGPEGMDFIGGGWLMSHATGGQKPWKKNYFLSCLKAKPPSRQDKCFWHYAKGAIHIYGNNYIVWKKFWVSFGSFVGRFYRQR